MRKTYRKLLHKARNVTHRDERHTQATTSSAPTIPASSESSSLNIIYSRETARFDLVAIHGHGGHWERSWTDRDSGVFWLRDFLPERWPESRVLSYGYDASSALAIYVEDIAADLVVKLARLRGETGTSDRPLVFLAHSFGGLLIKGAIGATSDETSSLSSSDFRSAIRGILFFGVPKNAQEAFGNLADLAGQGASEADSELIKTLRRDVSWLQDTNSRYSTVRHVFKEVYFVESAGEVCEDNGANQQSLIDSEASTDPAVAVVRLGKSHGAMVRFPGNEDEDFKIMLGHLSSILEDLTRSKPCDHGLGC